MKLSTIYRRAAKLVEDGHEQWSCWAICAAAGKPRHNNREDAPREVKKYEDWFASNDEHVWSTDWNESTHTLFDDSVHPASIRNCRVVALCLMAAIAKSEGK